MPLSATRVILSYPSAKPLRIPSSRRARPMPRLDVFEVMLREFLLEIEAGMKGDGVLPLGASAYDKYIHSSCFHHKFTHFPRLDKGPGQRGSGPQRTDSALQGATPEELHEEHWPVSDACPFLETKPGRIAAGPQEGRRFQENAGEGSEHSPQRPRDALWNGAGPLPEGRDELAFIFCFAPCPSLFN